MHYIQKLGGENDGALKICVHALFKELRTHYSAVKEVPYSVLDHQGG